MRYRVDELAARCGVSVDTVRYYQSRSLLPQPEREGRAAWYSEAHVERLERVKELKDSGFTLEAIGRFLSGDLDPADQALVAAVAGPGKDNGERRLTLQQLSEATGVTPTLLEAIEREGLLAPQRDGEDAVYSERDVEAVRAGLTLLESGLPLSELLALAREHDEAMRKIARQAIDMFIRFVRDPIRAGSEDAAETAGKLVDAFESMLPATTSLVSQHFRRVLLEEARARVGGEAESS